MALLWLWLTIAGSDPATLQDPFGDTRVIVEFQRAADQYAFAHRQAERRGAPASITSEGAFFTPPVAAAFRARIAGAINTAGCAPPAPATSFVVPRPGAAAGRTGPLAGCIVAVLPTLPPELEYRSASAALLLVDAHTHIVVDVMPGAFGAGSR